MILCNADYDILSKFVTIKSQSDQKKVVLFNYTFSISIYTNDGSNLLTEYFPYDSLQRTLCLFYLERIELTDQYIQIC